MLIPICAPISARTSLRTRCIVRAVVAEPETRRVDRMSRPAWGGHWTQPLGTGPIRLRVMVPDMPVLLPAVKV